MAGDQTRIKEPWDSALRLVAGPRLRGLQVDDLLAVTVSGADDVSVEAAVWALSFSTVSKRRLEEVILRLLDIIDDTTRTASIRGQAAEGVGELLQCLTKQARLRRTVTLRLLKHLTDVTPDVRFWSAFSLGKLRAKSARTALLRLTNDQTVVPGWWTVGGEAADALDMIDERWPPDRLRQA